MPVLNRLGNRLFAQWTRLLIGQPKRDVLSRTKAVWKSDYLRMQDSWAWSAGQDPFGDFDLLLSAAEMGLKIIAVPVPYHAR